MPATAEKKRRKVHPPAGAAGEPNPLQAAAEARRKNGGTKRAGTGETLSADRIPSGRRSSVKEVFPVPE